MALFNHIVGIPGSTVRKILAVLLIAMLACQIGSTEASAKERRIIVTGGRNLSFGTVAKPGSSTIAYNDYSSAEFRVEARKNKKVRMTVTATNLRHRNRYSWTSITHSLSNSDCAYSVDGGSTWTTFTTGTLYQDVTMPTGGGGGNTSEVLVRIGGSITSGSTQQSGDYSGTITLTAEYL